MQIEDRRAPNEVTKRIEQVENGECFMHDGNLYVRLLGLDKADGLLACLLQTGYVKNFGKGHEVSMVKATVVVEPPEEEA